MDLVTRDSLLALLEPPPPGEAPLRVSLFLGTHERGREAQADRLRLEHLIDQARADALRTGLLRPREVDALLDPAREVTGDLDFWREHGHGLAMFLGGEPRTWRLPLALSDQAVVGDRYHVKPLLPLLHGRGRFAILALSRKRARWIVADPTHAWEVEAPALPQGVETVSRFYDPEKTLQLHSGPPRKADRRRDVLFHGQGGVGADDEKVLTEAYCRAIDQGLQDLVAEAERPVVLAGDGALLAQLRSVSGYRGLVAEEVRGNHDRTPVLELHARALPLVEPLLRSEEVRAARRVEEATTRGVDQLPRILERAEEGRVALLFVALDRAWWGPERGPRSWVPNEVWRPGDVDLLDLAAAETLRHGGEVYAVPAAQIPGSGGLAAAVLRY